MNKRQIQLVRYLMKRNDWVKGEQLAAYLNVSSRTIRNDIQSLQSTGIIIDSSKKDGYRMDNSVEIVRLLEQKNEFPENAHDRMMYILKRLLHYSEPQNVYDLADDLFVSESTIEKDLYRLKAFISKTEGKVRLKRVENTFMLEGSIRARRTLWSKLLLNEVKENFIDINAFENQFNEVKLNDINKILQEILPDYEIYLNDLSMISMVIHIAIVVDTILRNEETISTSEIDYTSSKDELAAAQRICEKIEKMYSISIPLPETEYIAILLGGKKSFYFKDTLRQVAEKNIDSYFITLAKELIISIRDTFLVDLTDDDKLLVGLSMHLKSLYNRNRRGVEIHNPILTDTQKNFPLIYDMGIFMGLQYEKKTSQKLNEDEIGLLTLHLCIAFERLAKHKQKGKRLAILCPTGFTTSRLLKAKLENEYGEKINELKLFSISDREAITNFNPDLILTTSKVPEDFPFATIEVSPFLSEIEKEKISTYFQPIEKALINEDISIYFDKNLFFKDLKVQTPNEVIAFLSTELNKRGIVPSKYSELILAREAISSTAFGNLIALPHPIEKVASKTVIAVSTLKKPIQWGPQKVQLVLLFALANDKKELMDSLFREIIDLLDNPRKVKEIIQVDSYESFLQLIK
ncbi:BglG family transcription antiterminator [Heyndrickxia vini]|uniref:Transcription antiterminator n=1 Tax=Heyndrickxia vini TaxID=1476025 RepID=A0ABX7E536_9BACI|nr:BglG family transcription antiterminator [Heyndrickxia vini]QQZ10415.1 transcription antiterminator [Heyndrickxia vini]